MHSLQRKVLRTICPDQKGLIARITNICYKHELNIVQNNEFVDHRTGRVVFGPAQARIFKEPNRVGPLDSAPPDGGDSGDERGALSGRSADESQLRRAGCRYCRGYRQP